MVEVRVFQENIRSPSIIQDGHQKLKDPIPQEEWINQNRTKEWVKKELNENPSFHKANIISMIKEILMNKYIFITK